MPTYNFANVVDDHLMNITHVVRGSEYLSSTPKYNLLYQAFGWEIPQYVHLPLIMGRDAEGNVSKLSKRHGSVSFENLVMEGYLPEAIINYIALLGWSPKSDREIFTLSELIEAFNTNGLNKAAAIFDYDKLRWMNSEYIKMMKPEDFAQTAKAFAKVEGTPLDTKWNLLAQLLQQRTEVFADIPSMIDFLFEQPEYDTSLFNHKKSKASPETAKKVISDLIGTFEAMDSFDGQADNLNQIIMDYATANELKVGQPMWGVRIAVSGKTVTPGGPGEIMEILGKAEAIKRLNKALTLIG
jgi:glutamyl-tRNA synthetase